MSNAVINDYQDLIEEKVSEFEKKLVGNFEAERRMLDISETYCNNYDLWIQKINSNWSKFDKKHKSYRREVTDHLINCKKVVRQYLVENDKSGFNELLKTRDKIESNLNDAIKLQDYIEDIVKNFDRAGISNEIDRLNELIDQNYLCYPEEYESLKIRYEGLSDHANEYLPDMDTYRESDRRTNKKIQHTLNDIYSLLKEYCQDFDTNDKKEKKLREKITIDCFGLFDNIMLQRDQDTIRKMMEEGFSHMSKANGHYICNDCLQGKKHTHTKY